MLYKKKESIFRHKTNSHIGKKYTDNKIYFGIDRNKIRPYSKDIDKILFKWIVEVNNEIKFDKITEGSEDDLILKKSILRCTKEILYDIIRSFDNMIDIHKLQAIGIVSYAIAYKLMAGYDFDNFPGFKYLAYLTDNGYYDTELMEMEIDILIKTDWNPCKKTYKRLRDRVIMDD